MLKREFGWLLVAMFVFVSGCSCGPASPALELPATLETDPPGLSVVFTAWSASNPVQEKTLVLTAKKGSANIFSIDVVGDKGFSLVTKLKPPITLSPEKPLKLTVRFAPGDPKLQNGRLRIGCSDCYNVDKEGFFYVKLGHELPRLEERVAWNCSGTLAFGSVSPGKSSALGCSLSNQSGSDLVLKSVQYVPEVGGLDAGFAWKTPELPVTLQSGERVEVEVTFSPTKPKKTKFAGHFLLEFSSAESKSSATTKLGLTGSSAGSAQVELIPKYPPCSSAEDCTRIDARLRCSEVSGFKDKTCREADGASPLLKFPLTSKGKVTRRTFFLRSIGEQPAIIEDIGLERGSSRDFKVLTSNVAFPLTLSLGEEREITVEYGPSDDLPDTGKLSVTSNSFPAKASLLLEASQRGCNLQVQPLKLDFPGAVTKQVTIVNTGNENCLIHKIYLESGKTSHFSLLPTPSPEQTLVSKGSISFLVKFSPQSNDASKDFVVIDSDDPDEPAIKVELNHTTGPDGLCLPEAVSKTLDFGLVSVGRTSKQSVTITNKGWGDCEITALKVLGTNPAANSAFQLTSAIRTPFKIASGSNIRVEVSYTPPVERSVFEGKIEILHDGRGRPDVKLVGSSHTLCLKMIPPHLDFGSTKFGCATPPRSVEIFHTGHPKCSKSISITSINLAKNTTSEFHLKSAPATPTTLKTGQSMQLALSYKALDLGVDTATLEVGNSTPGQSPLPVPLVGEGVATSDQKDVFKQITQPKRDIAFIIDDSSSMRAFQKNLSANFQAYMNWVVRLNVNYQIMVTTTDTTGSRFPAGCAQGTTKIISSQTPNLASVFQMNTNVGPGGSEQTKGLEAAYRMLTPPASTGCNKGFLRKDAELALIFVSNRVDNSPLPVHFYIRFFNSLKGFRRGGLLRASVIGGRPPVGCKFASGGSASPAPRYWEVSRQLRGVQGGICSSEWSSLLTSMSLAIIYKSQFFLSRKADPNTIQVKVNGVPVKEDASDGWQYDRTNNTVNFSKSQLPKPGATIQVEYKAVCLP